MVTETDDYEADLHQGLFTSGILGHSNTEKDEYVQSLLNKALKLEEDKKYAIGLQQ